MSDFPIVHRVKGRFMELPRDHVNAFIVEMEDSVVIVDTMLALSSARDLREKAESLGKPIEAVLMTHGHPDHYSGLKVFEDISRLGSQGCLDFARREDEVKASTAKGYLGDDWPDVRAFPNKIIRDGDSFTFGGVEFTFYDLGPGESDSDGIWVFKEDGRKHVFAGDLIANRCHCFFRDGHLEEWNQILDRLSNDFGDPDIFYYGHGETPGGKEMIEWQRGYNNAFLEAVTRLKDKSVPVSEKNQQEVIGAMQKYLPGEATLFLLTYELDVTIEELWKKLGLID
jgi:glyoxylase-like metal-dependent hydrolase (beta-lactamase superfamily II)